MFYSKEMEKHMYNKYIFINNNRRKKQQEIEEQKKLENPQISFDMLMQMAEENTSEDTKENENFENVNKFNNTVNEKVIKQANFLSQNQTRSSQSKSGKGRNLNRFVDDYVLVDIETTGLSPIQDDIIEIGAIKVKNNEVVDKYSQLININRNISSFTTNLTGITNDMLKTGKMPKVVLEEFVNFVGNSIIIGHNVNFDLGFLCDKCRRYLNYNLNNDYIDTLYLARRLVPNSINYKLGTLAHLFHISYEGAHRGLKDVEITYAVYNKLRSLKS